MKLTHFALLLTVALLGVTTWLAWNAHTDATSARNQLELYQHGVKPGSTETALAAQEQQMLLDEMSKNKAAAAAPPPPMAPYVPAPAPVAAANLHTAPPPPLAASPHISQHSLEAEPPPITPQQQMVQNAPSIGKVSDYQKQYGFVVVTAGANRKLEKGMSFALRHEGFIVGRIKITEVDNNSAVGDLDGKTLPEGVSIEVGDDVIQDMPPL